MTREALIESLIAAAKQHGEDSEPDHEVGDLQDCLRIAAELLTDEQFDRWCSSDAVVDTLEWGGGS